MSQFLLFLAALNLVVCFCLGLDVLLGNRQLKNLRSIPPLDKDLPSLTIVVAARNEARGIAEALDSLLHLDYPDLQIVVVNDRSTDGTGELLDQMAATHAQVSVEHVKQLPAGWLGKNHALWCGARELQSELILFTDADVVMEPSTLRRAVRYLQEEQLDHLPMLFRVEMPTWLLRSFVVVFCLVFAAYFRPWKSRDPKSSAHVGIGGFNLIRNEVYRKIGTYQAIRMRPDDDVKLGKLVKKQGFRQDVVLAPDFLTVQWYSSLSELVRGLEKNAFSGVDYRIWLVVASSFVALVFDVFPFVAVFFTRGVTQWIYAAVVVTLMIPCAQFAKQVRQPLSTCLGFPLAMAMLVFIQWRTMILNLWQGGIRWRDTHYRLEELKANRI